MPLDDSHGISRGQASQGRFAVRKQMLRPGQRRLQAAGVADTRVAAIIRDDEFVERQEGLQAQPMRLFHLASSPRAFR